MNVSSVKLVYFSPTGTTKKVLEGIAQGLGVESIEHVGMTMPDAESKSISGFSNELAIIGAPVYGGRLPADAVTRLKRLKARNTPAVVVVVYGNREYEDALLELSNLSKEIGFIPISAGAFIGEHSFSTGDMPIAEGRPDIKDIETATDFGKAIAQKITDIQTLDNVAALEIPGNFPHKDGMPPLPGAPKTLDELCTTCGTCAEVCPKAAITVGVSIETDGNLCIKCCACVKECPTGARIIDLPFVKTAAKWLHESYSSRKEPVTFL